MRRLYLALAILSLTPSLFAQRDFSKVEIKAVKVAGSVYMLTGAGGNIGASIGDDGIVVVDDQFAPLAPKIEAALRLITPKPVRFILNTHYHGDHTGGNEHFGKSTTIVAQTNVRKRLASGTTVHGENTPAAPAAALPVITFDDSVSLHLNGEEITAIHFAHGHTDGDAVIWFMKSNVVHMGDDFFNGTYPFIDRENGGTVRGVIEAIDQVVALLDNDTKVIPGHGPLSDKKGLEEFVAMLKDTSAAVQAAKTAGKTLEQAQSDKILAQWDAKWGGGFIKSDDWIRTIYEE